MCFICKYPSVNIMLELKRNILNSDFSINFKHEGMLLHSFDIFFVITKFVLPKIKDLKLMTIQPDSSGK